MRTYNICTHTILISECCTSFQSFTLNLPQLVTSSMLVLTMIMITTTTAITTRPTTAKRGGNITPPSPVICLRRRRSLSELGGRHFCLKIMYEKDSKMPEFYMKIDGKIFSRFFLGGGGARVPLIAVSYASEIRRSSNGCKRI